MDRRTVSLGPGIPRFDVTPLDLPPEALTPLRGAAVAYGDALADLREEHTPDARERVASTRRAMVEELAAALRLERAARIIGKVGS